MAVVASGGALAPVIPAAADSKETSPCVDGSTPALLSSVICAAAGNYTLEVPAGTTDVDVSVVGGGGGAGYPARQHVGGHAAEVTGSLILPADTAYLYVIVGAGGGGNNTGRGYGGGGSGIFALDAKRSLMGKLVIAGAGGGGAYNGDGGDAGSEGTSENETLAAPGRPAVGGLGGAGGAGNYNAGVAGASNNPAAATLAAGGAGGVLPSGSVGGSGGGGYGGGGGGAAGSQGILNTYAGGGGGGSSLASSYLLDAVIQVRTGTGGIQLPGLVAGDGSVGSVTMTFDGAAAPEVPDAPTGVSAVAGDGEALVSFRAPSGDGGSAVTGFRVLVSPGGASVSCVESPCLVSGLENGTAYTFRVVAVNRVGDSVESSESVAVVPAGVPDAPTGVSAVAGDGEALVSFRAPSGDGGSAVTGFWVLVSPGGASVSCVESPCLVSGLENGTAYTFRVVAVNRVGDSLRSLPSAGVTPFGIPGAPTRLSVTPGDRKVSVSFSAPADSGGARITSYTVTARPGGATVSCPSSPCTVRGLRNGTAYRFAVRSTNARGTSPASAWSTVARPALAPATWYRDPLSSKQRKKLAPVPAEPKRKKGAVRGTRAMYRTNDGALAVPLRTVRGHQLRAKQGVQLTDLFRFDSARLTKSGRKQLTVVARSMKNVRAITCEGHADYAGSILREKKLAKERARAVCKVLKQKRPGLSTKVIGYGPDMPAMIGGTASQRDANRRVAILVRR